MFSGLRMSASYWIVSIKDKNELFFKKRILMKKENYPDLNYEILLKPCGDPFVDAGGFVLKKLSEENPKLGVLDLIDYAAEIYVDNWGSRINKFFLNSKITNPNVKEYKKDKTKNYFLDLLNNKFYLEEKLYHPVEGFCRITGIKTKLFPARRDNSCLTGSGEFVNFSHHFEPGLMVSKEVLIKYFFLPLASEQLLGKIAVINSNNVDISRFYAEKCWEKIKSNLSSGLLKNKAQAIGTAIFRFLDSIFTEFKGNAYITLYLFTNFANKQSLDIYTLPLKTFYFYRETRKKEYREKWDSFVKSKYYKQKMFYDFEEKCYKNENGTEEYQESEFEYWQNSIYDKLLKELTILPDICKWSKEHPFDIELLKCYLINLRDMKEKTINKINQIAEYILSDENNIKKRTEDLNGFNNSSELRRFIVKLIKENYERGNSNPLVTVNEYVNCLFPDSSIWMELRDILLISIYQKLHERGIKINNN